MAKSYNGWSASPNLKTRVIEPVKGVKLRVRDNDNIALLFTYLVQEYHERVDSVTGPHKADDWGFAYRVNRNAKNLSNHASATAIDLDATEHPNGVPTAKTFTQREIREVHKILSELDGVIAWGGDYRGTPDAMHFEIAAKPGGNLWRTAAKIRKKMLSDSKKSSRKTNVELAKEVLLGKWGNGAVRTRRLKKAGYNPKLVQAEVVKLLKK